MSNTYILRIISEEPLDPATLYRVEDIVKAYGRDIYGGMFLTADVSLDPVETMDAVIVSEG